jgi:PAS domain S-box-containing protein
LAYFHDFAAIQFMTPSPRIEQLSNSVSLKLPNCQDIIDLFPLTVTPETPVVDAIALMSQPPDSNYQINQNLDKNSQPASCILVIDQNKVKGIFTEKDVARLTNKLTDLSGLTIAEVMIHPVRTVERSQLEDFLTVLSILYQHQISHLPVVDENNQLVGIITLKTCLPLSNVLEMAGIITTLQQQLEQTNTTLEEQVAQRTAELSQANALLQQEIALRNNQEQARQQLAEIESIYASVPIGLSFMDTNLKFIRINEYLAQINNVPVAQHIGRTLGDVLPNLSDQLEPLYQQVLESGLPIINRKVHGHSPAQPDVERYWLVNYYPLRGHNGEIVGINSVVQDITERQETEEKLRQQAQIINQIHDSVIATDLEGYITIWNQGAERLIGYSATEAIGQHISLLYPGELRDVLENQIIAPLLATGEHEIEVVMQNKWGKRFDTLLSLSLLHSPNNTPIGMIGYAIDITARKQAEEKIREQAALINIATDAIFVCNLDKQILFWNRGAESIYEWSAAEALGKNANDLLYEKILPEVEAARLIVVTDNSWQGELHQVTKHGKKIIVQSRWTLVRNQLGEPQSILIVNTDITEKKQLEAKFLRTQRLENLGILASGIAHDLNNILTPILTTTQLLPLRLVNVDEQSRQLLNMQQESAKRGAELIQQILSFAQGVEGKHFPLQVKHMLREIEQIVKSTFPKSIVLETDIPKTISSIIIADPTQIHQVLMNLCVNARDAMPDGGTLGIAAENFFVDEQYAQMNPEAQVGKYIMISVSDTGTGIAPDVLKRIFEPFFTTKEYSKGTGLGLSTVIGILKNHGGFIQVESQVGVGSKFKVYFPISEQVINEGNLEIALPKGKGELILIVDDEDSIRNSNKFSLSSYNYKVMTANDGIEAVSVYAQHQHEISLVLMDVEMPSMDGIRAIQVLCKINPRIKIIAMSGLVSNRDRIQEIGLCVSVFLLKPYSLKQLLEAVHFVLGDSD